MFNKKVENKECLSCFYCSSQEKLTVNNSNNICVCEHCEAILEQTKQKVLACC